MAHIRTYTTTQFSKGKPVRRCRVVWREPARDEFGVEIPGKTRARQENYATRADAEARRDELNAARHTTGTSALAEQRKAGELPFGHYARAWLDAQGVKVSRGKLKRRTVDEYERLLRCYVLDRFGAKAIASITPLDAEEYLAALVRKQSRQGGQAALTPSTVKHAWDVFARVLRYAVQHGALAANPADRVDVSANRSTGDHARFEHRPLTAEQVGALCAAIAGNPPDAEGAQPDGPTLPAYPVYALMVEFMAYTGLRASEVAGLEVRDLTLMTTPDSAMKGSVRIERTLKSKHSRRTVPLPPWLAVKMVDYLAVTHARAEEPTASLWPSRKNGGGYRAKGERYAVPLDWSKPLAMGTFYDTIMKPALEAVGLPASRPARTAEDGTVIPATNGVRVHDLRHTFAVLQLSAGVHFMQVAKWLGHATYTLTLDVYGDYIPEHDGGAANNLPEPTAPATPAEAAGNVVPLRRRARS